MKNHACASALLCLAAVFWSGAPAAESSLHGPALIEKIERARTRADHEALARHFAEQARELRGQAQEHEAMARSYERSSSGDGAGGHCLSLAANLHAAAAESDVLATLHRKMADSAPARR